MSPFLDFRFLLLIELVSLFIPSAYCATEFKQGRYIGSIELASTQNKLAVVADFHLESPDDLKLFPSLHAAIKTTLGGYNTHEYTNETFKNIRYDFENGFLTLDDPQNDLVLTAELRESSGNPQIVGDVFIRSSAQFGKITLDFETDEPGEDSKTGWQAGETFISLLDGQYEGTCQGERAVLQLQTVRGLKTQLQSEPEISGLSRDYGISGRIGLRNSTMCGELPLGLWCTHFTYGGGSYNPYLGKLLLRSQSATDACAVQRDVIKCQIRRTLWNKDCEFKKVANTIKAPRFYSRGFNLTGTPEQLKELPEANPPKNTELANAVRGTFAGYVHNETNNTYQYLQLNVVPFSFTENPHNPNQMMISSTASLHLGGGKEAPFITQRFEPRSFYIRPGFTLNGPTTDSFINISEWKRGFIRGVLYSRVFGRVGTVQLIKETPPVPPQGTELVHSFAAEYDGPLDKNGLSANLRWFRLLFPAQPNDLADNLIRFSGSFNPTVGVSGVHNIEKGTFDPFTGVFGWLLEHGGSSTFVNGRIDRFENAVMYWPPAPGVFGAYMADYVPEIFKRK